MSTSNARIFAVPPTGEKRARVPEAQIDPVARHEANLKAIERFNAARRARGVLPDPGFDAAKARKDAAKREIRAQQKREQRAALKQSSSE